MKQMKMFAKNKTKIKQTTTIIKKNKTENVLTRHAQDKFPFHSFLLLQRFLRAIHQSCTYSLHIFHIQF